MKRIKISLAALAFVFAIGAAVTPKLVKAFAPPPPTEESLYWFDQDGNYNDQQVKSLEIPSSGCPNTGSQVCENGYHQDQLADQTDPSQGLKSSPTVTDMISRP